MNINSLLYVIEIEKCGSINRAAQNLYISQSNLSANLKSLEEELGYHLFHRTSSGITLTPEGYLFLQSAKAIQVELDKIRRVPELIDAFANISLSCTWSSRLLQCFIDYKGDNHPEVLDSVKETGLLQTFRDVQESRYRIAIFYCFHSRTAHHQKEAEKTNLVADVLISHVPAVALVGTDHPLAKQHSVKLADLYLYPMAIFEDFGDADWIYILKTPAYQRILYLYDRGAIIDAVAHGGYISVTKQGAVCNHEADRLIELPITDLDDDLDILLLRRRAYVLNEREKEFVSYLQQNITD